MLGRGDRPGHYSTDIRYLTIQFNGRSPKINISLHFPKYTKYICFIYNPEASEQTLITGIREFNYQRPMKLPTWLLPKRP
jgi:hypothetical protein